MESDVVAVVLNWNNYDDTSECLRSLLDLPTPLEIVVVDNGSTDRSGSRIGSEFPVHMESLPQNEGFAGGMNRGIERALKLGADYVWLLNNDTLFPDGQVVEMLVGRMEAAEDIGIVSPLIREYPETGTIWFERGIVDSTSGEPIHALDDKSDGSRVIENEYIPLCAALIRAEVFKTVSLLPEELFLYYEDVAFADGVRSAGFRLVTETGTEAHHKVSASSDGALAPVFSYYVARNILLYNRRTPYRKLSAFGFGQWALRAVVQRGVNGRFDGALAVIQGIVDGLRGKNGRGPYP